MFLKLDWWTLVLAGSASALIMFIKIRSRGSRCISNAGLSGKTVIVTGANCGIGKATALELVKRKAKVILACRDIRKGNKAAQEILSSITGGKVEVRKLDLASLSSIDSFVNLTAASDDRIDILINNAAVFQCNHSQTENGFEMQMGVNHLGHFYLTNLLLKKFKGKEPSRIIIVSSMLHKNGKIDFENLNSEKSYDKKKAYSNSKLANNLFARELSQKLSGTNTSVFCVSPGIVNTNLGRHIQGFSILRLIFYPLIWLLLKSPKDGCQTILHCAVAEELDYVSGVFFRNCKQVEWTPVSMDETVSEQLWDVSAKLTNLI